MIEKMRPVIFVRVARRSVVSQRRSTLCHPITWMERQGERVKMGTASFKRRSQIMLVSVLLANTSLLAGGSVYAGEPMDATERWMELGLHERLVQRKLAPGTRLAAFTTDGCSGGLSAGWEYLSGRLPSFRAHHGDRPPWEDCCVAHDRLYHVAGARESTPAESFDARKEADLALRTCVMETGVRRAPGLTAEYGLSTGQVAVLYETVADLMYRSVRIGGVPCSGLPWRWGYGWPECE